VGRERGGEKENPSQDTPLTVLSFNLESGGKFWMFSVLVYLGKTKKGSFHPNHTHTHISCSFFFFSGYLSWREIFQNTDMMMTIHLEFYGLSQQRDMGFLGTNTYNLVSKLVFFFCCLPHIHCTHI